jgi:hypothetical protein
MGADAAQDAFARFLRALLGALGAAPAGAGPADAAEHGVAAGHQHASQQEAEALLAVHAEDALHATARVLGAPGYARIVADAARAGSALGASPDVRLGLLQARSLSAPSLSAPCRMRHAGFHA